MTKPHNTGRKILGNKSEGAKKDIERSLRIGFWILLDLILLLVFALFIGAGVPYILTKVYGMTDPIKIAIEIAKWLVPTIVLLVGVYIVFYIFRKIMRGR